MTTKCTGLMGRIFGHKFIACFSTRAARPIQVEGSRAFAEMMLEKTRDKVYHHSVCQRCGAVTGEKK